MAIRSAILARFDRSRSRGTAMPPHDPCTCRSCAELMAGSVSRRGLLRWAGLGAAGAALAPYAAWAQAKPTYDAMVLSCIDPRIIDPVNAYMTKGGMAGRYSQFVIAGAAVAVEAPLFKTWHETFWDNLKASIDLHKISRVIAIDHRDCGAAKLAYGADSIATPEKETATHRRVLAALKREMHHRHPAIAVDGYLMALDGQIEQLTT
jgi:carbonic anhydrase